MMMVVVVGCCCYCFYFCHRCHQPNPSDVDVDRVVFISVIIIVIVIQFVIIIIIIIVIIIILSCYYCCLLCCFSVCRCHFSYSFCHSFGNYLILNWRETRWDKFCENICMSIEYDRTPVKTDTYLSLCLRPLSFYICGSRSRSNIDPIKSNNSCTSFPLGGWHVLFLLILIWCHWFDLRYNSNYEPYRSF